MLPKAFLARMKELLGGDYPAFLQSMETGPVRALRVNFLKTSSVPADIETKPLPFSGGGYIFSSDHSIPNDVSLENFRQIVAQVKESGRYD